MLKIYNNNLIGYCETGVSEFGLYGQDTEKVFKSLLNSQPSDWKYRTEKVFYNRNSCGHRSKEISELDSKYILFLGCSITVGSSVALEETFPYIVSNTLGIDYYNLAVEGAGYDLIAHNVSEWIKLNPKPYAVVIKWPQESRSFRIRNSDVIPLGPWNCKEDIGNAITKDEWRSFESIITTDYFEHYSKIIRNAVVSLLESQGIKIIEVSETETIDVGRDLKHPGTASHSLLASSILKSFGQ